MNLSFEERDHYSYLIANAENKTILLAEMIGAHLEIPQTKAAIGGMVAILEEIVHILKVVKEVI